MSKQDRQGVRKASDIEQKYGLGQFMYDQRQKNQDLSKGISNLGDSFSIYKTENDQNITKLKENTDSQFKKVSDAIGDVTKEIDSLSKAIFDMVYPVGAIYVSVSDTKPSTLFGGTWERIKDTFLLAAGSTYAAGATGGEAEHTLTKSEMPSHRHGWATQETSPTYAVPWPAWEWQASAIQSANTPDSVAGHTDYQGESKAHNNMPPYLAVYVWKRTA